VEKAVRQWAVDEVKRHPHLIRLGYFGSYAKGDWGVGSDLDLIAVVSETQKLFERRNTSWNLETLPVPTDLLVYTLEEWQNIQKEETRFARTLREETIWIYETGNGQR
jgi:predicted nucleotidyltransferase